MTNPEVLARQFCKLTIEIEGYCELFNYKGLLNDCPYEELTHLWINRTRIWQALRDMCGYEVARDMTYNYLPEYMIKPAR